MSFNLIRRGSFALGAVIAALTIAACGSSSSSSSSASSGSSGTAAASTGGAGSRRGFFGDPAQRAKLVACLKQHGVTLPARPPVPQGSGSAGGPGSAGGSGSSSGPGTTPGGAPPGGGAARPRFFGGGRGFSVNPKFRAALKACGVNFPTRGRFNPAARKAAINKFVTCVRQHGYNLPKPNLSGHGAVLPSKIQSDPKFQAASKACASLLRPRGGPGGGPPPPSSA